jgi:hypothetical protein
MQGRMIRVLNMIKRICIGLNAIGFCMSPHWMPLSAKQRIGLLSGMETTSWQFVSCWMYLSTELEENVQKP